MQTPKQPQTATTDSVKMFVSYIRYKADILVLQQTLCPHHGVALTAGRIIFFFLFKLMENCGCLDVIFMWVATYMF